MIKITREQRNLLEKNGCVFGEDIHRTIGKSKKKSYYATESRKVLSLLGIETAYTRETYNY